MLIGQQRRVDGNAWAAGRAVAPTGWSCQGSRLGSLMTVGRHIDGSQPLLLLRQLLELILLLGVSLQLDEGTEEVDACHQDDEGHGAKEGSQAGLPGHPAAATHEYQCISMLGFIFTFFKKSAEHYQLYYVLTCIHWQMWFHNLHPYIVYTQCK